MNVRLCIAQLFSFAALELCAFPALSTPHGQISTASLESGETTPDGALTVVVRTLVSRDTSISLQNNTFKPLIVNTYYVSPRGSLNCSGVNLRLQANASQVICTIAAPEALIDPSPAASPHLRSASPVTVPRSYGRASIEVALRWHTVQSVRATSSPTPP